VRRGQAGGLQLGRRVQRHEPAPAPGPSPCQPAQPAVYEPPARRSPICPRGHHDQPRARCASKQAARLPQHPPALVHREQLEQVGARHHVGLPVRQRHVTRVAAQGSPAFWEPRRPWTACSRSGRRPPPSPAVAGASRAREARRRCRSPGRRAGPRVRDRRVAAPPRSPGPRAIPGRGTVPRARPMWPPRSLPRCSRRVGRLSERRGRRPPAPGATPGHPSIGRSVQRRRIVSPGEPPGIGVLPAASKPRARPRGDPRAQVCFPGVHAEAGRSTAARSQRLPAQLRIWKLASRCASGHTDRPSSPLDYLQMIDLNIVGLYLVAARKARDTFRRSGPRMHPQASVTAPAPGLGSPPRGRTTKPPAATYAGSATGPARVARLRTSTRRRGFERRAPRRPLGSERRGPSWRQR